MAVTPSNEEERVAAVRRIQASVEGILEQAKMGAYDHILRSSEPDRAAREIFYMALQIDSEDTIESWQCARCGTIMLRDIGYGDEE
jgi:hypothetical protein